MLHRFALAILLSLSSLIAQVGGTATGTRGVGVVRPTQPPPQFDPSSAGQALPGQQPQQSQAPATIEGSVTNAITGEPLKRATLILIPMQAGPSGQPPSSTISDASGRFSMNNIAPGSYRLMAERTAYVRTEYGSRHPGRPGSVLTVSPGQALKDVAVRMQPHAVIAGRVLDEDGEPLSGVQVQAMSQSYMQGRKQLVPSSTGSTNDLGEYRIFGLAPGKYYVNAVFRAGGMYNMSVDRSGNPGSAIPDEGYAPTYYPGSNDVTAAVPLQLAAGQPVTNIDFNLRRVRTVRVKGRVRGPVSNGRSMVMLLQQSDMIGMNSRNMSSTQGPDGTFEIRGVTPGAYYLVAQQSEQNVQYSGRMAINVGNSNVENLDIAVSPAMVLNGRVKIEGDAQVNLAGMFVGLQPKELSAFGGSASGRVNADGTFTIANVWPNTYRVTAGTGAQGVYVKAILAGEQPLTTSDLTVSEGAAPALTIVMSAASAQVTGQVTADPPTASQGSTVVLIPSSTDQRDRVDLYRTATTDQYGKFNLRSISPGEYTIYAWDDVEPGSWQDPEFVARFENKGSKVTLKENDTITVDATLLKVEQTQ